MVLFISLIVNETFLRTQAFVYESNVRKKNEEYRVATECLSSLVKLFLKAHSEQMLFPPKANYDLNNPSLHKFELYILYGSWNYWTRLYKVTHLIKSFQRLCGSFLCFLKPKRLWTFSSNEFSSNSSVLYVENLITNTICCSKQYLSNLEAI